MHNIKPYLPELFTPPGGNLLYVGARPDAHSWLSELYEVGHKISLLEVWPENAKAMRSDNRIRQVITGDVRNVVTALVLFIGIFDIVFWWHGPEHLAREEIGYILGQLECCASRLIVCACPWGVYPQGVHAGNPYETHLSYLYPESFLQLGYEVRTDGEADKAGSEIVAWKWK